MFNEHLLYPPKFHRAEPQVESQSDRPEPEFGGLIITINVHVWWLMWLMTIKIHAVRTRPQYCRHSPQYPTMPRNGVGEASFAL